MKTVKITTFVNEHKLVTEMVNIDDIASYVQGCAEVQLVHVRNNGEIYAKTYKRPGWITRTLHHAPGLAFQVFAHKVKLADWMTTDRFVRQS